MEFLLVHFNIQSYETFRYTLATVARTYTPKYTSLNSSNILEAVANEGVHFLFLEFLFT